MTCRVAVTGPSNDKKKKEGKTEHDILMDYEEREKSNGLVTAVKRME